MNQANCKYILVNAFKKIEAVEYLLFCFSLTAILLFLITNASDTCFAAMRLLHREQTRY